MHCVCSCVHLALCQLTFCHIEWIVKDHFVGSAFFDASASAFIMPTLLERATRGALHLEPNTMLGIPPTAAEQKVPTMNVAKEIKASNVSHVGATQTVENGSGSGDGSGSGVGVQGRMHGSALGPEWATKSEILAELSEEIKCADGSLQVRTFSDRKITDHETTCYCVQQIMNLSPPTDSK